MRPARRRDAVRVAVVFARSMERPRRHPPRLRKLIPLRPLRLALYGLTGLAIVLVIDMTLLAGPPSALLAVYEQDLRARARRVARALGWFVVFESVALVVGVLLALVMPGMVTDMLEWTTIGVLGVCGVRMAIANRPVRALRAAGQAWAAKLPGPVWWLTGYGSLDPQAAISLGRAVCELADTAGAVLLAVAEGTARIHAYQRAGFTVHRQIDVDQEPCALLVRWPRCGGKQQSPTSAPGRFGRKQIRRNRREASHRDRRVKHLATLRAAWS